MDDFESHINSSYEKSKYFQEDQKKAGKLTEFELACINKKAYKEALHDFLKTAYKREMVRTFCQDGEMPYVPKDPTMKKMLENQRDTIATKPPYIFLTINPKEDNFAALQKAVNKFVKKKTITHYYYVYEVRKENEGLHCHMVLSYNCKPYEFKRSTKNTFKNVCDSSNPHCLNFKFIEQDIIKDKIAYMSGSKKDSKLKGVEFSKAYRKANNIMEYYESSPPFPCRATQKTIGFNDVEPPSTPALVGVKDQKETETPNLVPL